MSDPLRSSGPASGPLDRLVRLADGWVPPALHALGREAVIRGRAMLAVVAIGTPAAALSAWLDLRIGVPLIGWITLAYALVGASIPFVLRRTGSLPLAGNLMLAVLFLMIFTPGVLTLGRGPAVLFLFLVPAFAVTLCGRRTALVWSLVAAAGVLALGALSASGWAAPVELPPAAPRLHRIAFLSLLVALACLLTYDAMKVAALRELERANAALRESREQYRQLVETSPDAVFVTRNGELLYVNTRGVELVGAESPSELLGHQGSEFIEAAPAPLARFREDIEAGRASHGVRLTVRKRSGERVPVETNASPTLFEGEPAVLSVVRDRSEEERTLARLRLLGTVVDQAHEGVLVVDAAGIVLYANEGYARTRGISAEALIGRPVRELPRDDAARSFFGGLRSQLDDAGGQLGGRFHFDGPAGRRSWDIRVFPVDVGDARGPLTVTLLRDVSREMELEESARQSQKMEAVGQLAGGIAHDFNNHLTVILGHAEELRVALPAGSPQRAELEAIVDAAERSAALTQQLLAFARRQAVDVGVLDLGEVVSGMGDMLRRLLPERIALDLACGDAVPAVLADRGQLEQVVLNLLLNARDAIEGAGRIVIRTGAGELPERLRAPAIAPHAGPHAILCVDDDGHGMDDAVRSRIFEPFFTTKPAGRGTGLGLSTVHGIVHQSGGAIEVDSRRSAGTRIAVYLPGAHGRVPAAAVQPASRPAPHPATGRVLLVEDDASVRHLGRRALEAAGFEVVEAADGDQALRALGGGAPDLVVSDIVMPGMSGVELAERIAARHPGIPVLLVSGYAEDAVESRGLRGAGRELLGKPFRPQQLVERVRRMLADRRG